MNLEEKLFQRPAVFTPSQINFWNDTYISTQLLKEHLDADSDGASRRRAFIEQSAAWICETMPASAFPALFDVGCGPGLYAQQFAQNGYKVTGIDLSERSICYAREIAQTQGLDITYHCQDYLTMQPDTGFDLATMIYCDYGALSPQNRQKLMCKIYACLNPGGLFLLDAFSAQKYQSFQEINAWEFCKKGGFWCAQPYLLLKETVKYENLVTLEQYVVLTEHSNVPYYIWNEYFFAEKLMQEARAAGFQVKEIFSDVAGAPYTPEGDTIALLLKKE